MLRKIRFTLTFVAAALTSGMLLLAKAPAQDGKAKEKKVARASGCVSRCSGARHTGMVRSGQQFVQH